MIWNHEERRRRKRNYRVMFKVELACLALAIVMTVLGGIRASTGADVTWFIGGLLMFIWSVGNAYLTVDSTVRVIELDMKELSPRLE